MRLLFDMRLFDAWEVPLCYIRTVRQQLSTKLLAIAMAKSLAQNICAPGYYSSYVVMETLGVVTMAHRHRSRNAGR